MKPGTNLARYRLLEKIGRGGMGEVWKATDTRLGREVAIKVLPPDVASDMDRLRRFEKEARSASALNHPNIVTIYDIGTSDSVSWIAMERVEGKTLREQQHQPWTPGDQPSAAHDATTAPAGLAGSGRICRL